MTIEIQCSQVVTYNQVIEVTEEEYALLMEYEGIDVNNDSEDKKAYNIIRDKLDHSEVFDANECYESILISRL